MGLVDKNSRAFVVSDTQAAIATHSPKAAIVPPPCLQLLTTCGSLYVSGHDSLEALRDAIDYAIEGDKNCGNKNGK